MSTPTTREKKALFLGYYSEGIVCRCGNAKERNHWCCSACKPRIWETPEGLALRDACAAHYNAATALLDSIAPATKSPELVPSARWSCIRCNSMVEAGRCKCTSSPSPWIPVQAVD